MILTEGGADSQGEETDVCSSVLGIHTLVSSPDRTLDPCVYTHGSTVLPWLRAIAGANTTTAGHVHRARPLDGREAQDVI